MLALWIGLGVLGFLLLAALVLSYVVYRIAFYQKTGERDPYFGLKDGELDTRVRGMVDAMRVRPCVRYTISSHDGLTLSARYYEAKPGAPLVIQCHGYRSTPMRDFAGGCPEFLSLGWNVLVIDERAHGESEGHTISFGVLERFDVSAWASFAKKTFGGVPILLFGVSMGAATVLLCCDLPKEHALPDTVVGVVADCPYSSPEEILRKVGRGMGVPMAVGMPLLRLGARLFGGFSFRGVSSAEAAKHSSLPILLYHGEADNFVPCEMSRKIAEGAGRVELHTFPGADHGLSYLVDTERYLAILRDFLSRINKTRKDDNV